MHINEPFTSRSKLQDLGRWLVTRHVESVAASLTSGMSILDAGAGECAYKVLFSHVHYKAIDLAVGEKQWNYGNLDYVGSLDNMPIESSSFDAVLCTQVLEHVEWPRECVKEMWRVLKTGGKLFMTVPMSHPEHQVPYDFFRYTSYGLRSICTQAGFSEVHIQPFGGLWTRWAYELPRALDLIPGLGIRSGSFNPKGIIWAPIRLVASITVRILQTLFLWLERFDKQKNDPFGWSVIAIK